MENKQKVYIKGNPNRGAEVIKALTDLGAINPNHYRGNDDTACYYINPNGEIAYASFKGSVAYPFLQEFYKEIELPKRKAWKDGDLLVQSNGSKKEYMVYSNDKIDISFDAIKAHICVSEEGYNTRVLCDASNAKLASVSDTNDFQKLLHTYGKEWNFKKKKLIDWKWKPKNNEEYWFINDLGEICHSLYSYFLWRDNKRIGIGNCFQTKTDAFNARNKMAKLL